MSSVDGLVSGMATTDIINQLMQLERQPVVRLQSRKQSADRAINALQTLNAKFASLAELAKKFKPADWTTPTATATPAGAVSVYAVPGTDPTSLKFTVNSIAAAHKVASADTFAAGTDKIADAGAAIKISYLDDQGAATSLTITNHDGSAAGIAAAINGASVSPVNAAVVADPAGGFRLEMTAKKTGDYSRFDVSGIIRTTGTVKTHTFNVATLGTDAEIVQGTGDFATTTKHTSNVFEIAEGISVSLKPASVGQEVSVTVTAGSKPADDVEKLVDAANAILKEIKSLTNYDATTKKGGLLQGNALLKGLQSEVVRAVSYAVGTESPATAGIQLTKTGEITFDKAKFEKNYAADPAKVAAVLEGTAGTPGVMQRLEVLAGEISKAGDGRLSLAIEARRGEVKRLDDSIASWDYRLVRKEAMLRKQFAALETALGRSQQQGNWLAGQIASLPTYSND